MLGLGKSLVMYFSWVTVALYQESTSLYKNLSSHSCMLI